MNTIQSGSTYHVLKLLKSFLLQIVQIIFSYNFS